MPFLERFFAYFCSAGLLEPYSYRGTQKVYVLRLLRILPFSCFTLQQKIPLYQKGDIARLAASPSKFQEKRIKPSHIPLPRLTAIRHTAIVLAIALACCVCIGVGSRSPGSISISISISIYDVCRMVVRCLDPLGTQGESGEANRAISPVVFAG